MKQMDKDVGKRIRIKRIERGITQGKLASNLGLSYQQVQKYEVGSNRVSSGRLFYIAMFLDTPMSYFFEDVPVQIQNQLKDRAKKRDALQDLSGMDNRLKQAVSQLISALKH